jgi:acyl carrier protein
MGNDIEGRLKRMIVERLFMTIAPEELDNDKSLIDDYGVDSVMLLELVVGLEEEFGVRIEDNEFSVRHFETVSRLAAFVRSKL